MIQLIDWKTCTDPHEKYAAYLCSEDWGQLRLSVRLRCHGICEHCRGRPMAHVHHLTYIRKFAEELTDLMAVCDQCHSMIHGWVRAKSALNDTDRMVLMEASYQARKRNEAITNALKVIQ